MNNKRRKSIGEIGDKIEEIKAGLESLRDDEKEYLDNMPEGPRDGEKGGTAQTALDNLDDAINNLEDAISSIGEAQN